MKNRSNLPDDLFFKLTTQGQACANKDARPPRVEKNRVVEVDVTSMWFYEYQAKIGGDGREIIACDSLPKLKRAIKERGWSSAWITTSSGMLSQDQCIIHEYFFKPRYRDAKSTKA